MEVKVEFDYESQEVDELTLKKGEVITNVVQKLDGWWEGTSNSGKRGLFPDNFVKVIPATNNSENEAVQLRKNSANSTKRYKALFSYSPEQEDELRLDVGDTIEFISEIEEGWWKGKLKGRIGIFPSNFVNEVVDSSVATDDTSSTSINISANRTDSFTKNSKDNTRSFTKDYNKPDVIPAENSSKISINEMEEEPAPKLPPKPVREVARCFYPYVALNDDELTLNEGDIVTIISKTCDDEGWWRGELKGRSGLFPDNFVKILTPSEMKSVHNNTHENSAPLQQGKMIAQVRKPGPGNGGGDISETDGSKHSKSMEATNNASNTSKSSFSAKELVGKPLGQIISRFGGNKDKDKERDGYSGAQPQKPPSSSHSSVSPTPLASAKRDSSSNIIGKPTDLDEEEFNSVERGEMLNHLKRAKPPKRRPPSAIITKELEPGVMNGNAQVHPTYSEDPEENKDKSLTGSANTSTSSPATTTPVGTKPKGVGKDAKPVPWMDELKKKQDKKKESPQPAGTGVSSNITAPGAHQTTPASSAIPPVLLRSNSKEPAPTPASSTAKAPPLPAKPNSVNSPTTPTAEFPGSGSSSNYFKYSGRRTSPAPASSTIAATGSSATSELPTIMPSTFPPTVSPNIVNNMSNGNSYSVGPSTTMSSSSSAAVGKPGALSGFVTIEEYCKLKDRVTLLEGELDLLRKQVRLLLDRDMSKGHIV